MPMPMPMVNPYINTEEVDSMRSNQKVAEKPSRSPEINASPTYSFFDKDKEDIEDEDDFEDIEDKEDDFEDKEVIQTRLNQKKIKK